MVMEMERSDLFKLMLLGFALLFIFAEATTPCVPVDFGKGSVACVCNATYCDTVPDLGLNIGDGRFVVYTSSKNGLRFRQTFGQFMKMNMNKRLVSSVVLLNRSNTYQSLVGFGGAFTDAACMNILNVSSATQDNILQSYFGSNGIQYTLGRVPMASCDFSVREYSYDDFAGDFELKNFSLTMEDLKLKIPIIQRAMSMSARPIKLFASPWSAPSWMKTNGAMTGRGFLIGQPGGPYYKAWANYFVRFLQEYRSASGLTFWAVTAQNEPMDGRIPAFPFQCMGFTAELQRDFIASDLGPALHASGFGDVNLIILDDNRFNLPAWAKTVYSNATAANYVSGVGVHWYLNAIGPVTLLDETHELDPSKFILATEACAGSAPFEQKVILGSWERAEDYAADIIADLQHWVAGWTDWNLALNPSGGPNWANNFVDSPIIIDASKDLFYKQPMFYALGHFSKFLPTDSIRIGSVSTDLPIDAIAFVTPDNSTVLVLNNRQNSDVTLQVVDPVAGSFVHTSPARSIETIIWKP